MRLGFDKMRVLVASLLCLVAAGETTTTKSAKLHHNLKHSQSLRLSLSRLTTKLCCKHQSCFEEMGRTKFCCLTYLCHLRNTCRYLQLACTVFFSLSQVRAISLGAFHPGFSLFIHTALEPLLRGLSLKCTASLCNTSEP